MRVTERCIECLWERQLRISDDPEYLSEVRNILDNHRPDDCSPYLVFLFNKAYEKHYGKRPSYTDVKKSYNDFVLSMEESISDRLKKK